MHGFEGELSVKLVRGDQALIEKPINYYSRDGRIFTIPPGFVSDLVSAPRILRFWMGRWEQATRPAVLHDYLYCVHDVSRLEADRLFHEALLAEGTPSFKAFVMFKGVRWFGARGWHREGDRDLVLTRELLEQYAPRPRRAGERRHWNGYMDALCSPQARELFDRYEITTQDRFAALMATWGHESNGFRLMFESLHYTSWKRLKTIFGYPNHSAAIRYHERHKFLRNGPALGERAYGLLNPGDKWQELGNIKPGDGYRFRGTGIQQLTGRRDHEKYAHAIGVAAEQMSEYINSIHGALEEWEAKGCNALCDRGDFRSVRIGINGGLNGIGDYRARLVECKRIWPASLFRPVVAKKGKPKLVKVEDVPVDDGVLRLGSKGPDVVILQERLARAGFPVGATDGKFGKITRRQLMAFQAEHELETNGEILPNETDEAWKTLANAKPEVRDVDVKDLAQRGSETIKKAQRKSWLSQVWTFVFGGAFAGEAAGLEPVNTLLNYGDKVKSAVGGISALTDWLLQPKILLLSGGVILSVISWRFAKWMITNRVEDAQIGGHHGK